MPESTMPFREMLRNMVVHEGHTSHISATTTSNNFYRIIEPIIMIIGLLGNILGLYVCLVKFALFNSTTNLLGTWRRLFRRHETSESSEYLPLNKPRKQIKSLGGQHGVTQPKKNLQASDILNTVLFSVNVVNGFLMIPWPILDSYQSFYRRSTGFELKWNLYLVHIHFPVSMIFIDYSYLVTMLCVVNYFVAVVYPYDYKWVFGMRHIQLALGFLFVYVVVWNIPTSFYMVITSSMYVIDHPEPPSQRLPSLNERLTFLNLNPNLNHVAHANILSAGLGIPGHLVSGVLVDGEALVPRYTFKTEYRRVVYEPPTKGIAIGWFVYNLSREIFTKVIPFLTTVLMSVAIFTRRKDYYECRLNYELANRSASAPKVSTSMVNTTEQMSVPQDTDKNEGKASELSSYPYSYIDSMTSSGQQSLSQNEISEPGKPDKKSNVGKKSLIGVLKSGLLPGNLRSKDVSGKGIKRIRSYPDSTLNAVLSDESRLKIARTKKWSLFSNDSQNIKLRSMQLNDSKALTKMREDKQKKLVLMTAMIFNFVIFLLPATIMKMMGGFALKIFRDNVAYHRALNVCITLEYVFIGATFYIFVIFSKAYRKHLVKLLKHLFNLDSM